MKPLVVIICCYCVVNPLFGDIITLKGGLVFEGIVIERDKEAIKLDTFNGAVTIPTELIKTHDPKKSRLELYQEQLKKLKEDDSACQYELGKWCKTKKLWSKAILHLKKAAELSPDNKDVAKTLDETDKLWEKEHQASLIPFTLNVGVVVDMTEDELKKLGEVIKKRISPRLAETTGGIMYIKEAIFTDNCRQGDMRYDPKHRGVVSSSQHYTFGPDTWNLTILHEFGHMKLGPLGDEYNTRPACGNCIMALKIEKGWCNSLNHPKGCRTNAPGCQERLIAMYAKKCPMLAEAFNRAPDEIRYPPETIITIKNTGN